MALNLDPQTEFSGAETAPGDTQPTPGIEEISRLFPHLEIVECLGRGGMGVVYKARQPRLDRWVALKIISPGREKDPRFAERFAREARSLARLSHPSIVAIHDFGEVAGHFFLLMEYVDGLNLRALLRARNLAPEAALRIVPAICEALQYAHQQGIVHRDIKPENILIDPQGRVKIADFGIAKILGAEPPPEPLTGDQQVVGTPNYMAPEQVEKPASVDHRADIYSLGVVFYEMLTGELPLGKFPPPSNKVQIDVRLDEIVLHALEKEPERRYQQAAEVKTALQSLKQAPQAPPRMAEPFAAADPWAQVRGPGIGLIITGVLNWFAIPAICLTFAYFMLSESPPRSALWMIPLSVLVLSTVILLAGFKMKGLEAWGLAVAGSFLAMLTTPGNLIGLPVGIWSLVVLMRPETRAAFAARAAGRLGPAPVRPGTSGWKWAAVAIAGVLVVLLALPVGSIVLGILLPALQRAKAARAQEMALRVPAGSATEAEDRPSNPAAPPPAQPAGVGSSSVAAEPQVLRVRADGTATHTTVRAAMEAAKDGSVIEIGPGRFEAPLVIDKAVSIVGAGWTQTVIGPVDPKPGAPAEALREAERRFREARTEDERRQIRDEFRAAYEAPVVQIRSGQPVVLSGVRFSLPGVPPEGKLLSTTVVQVQGGQVTLRDCAVVGSSGNGLTIGQGASVTVSNCLVAAAWNTGIQIERAASPGRVRIVDSDIRNCYYAGITTRAENLEIRRCRISGAAWHGIRYDGCSPTIEGNLIYGNARSGIYASGQTEAHVRGNVFWKNEMNGLSAWFNNRDLIYENTFAANLREGLAILGASEPAVRQNVFWSSPVAIGIGDVNDRSSSAKATGQLNLRDSIFWTNGANIVFGGAAAAQDPTMTNRFTLEAFSGCQELDPQFQDPARGDFRMPSGSVLRAGASSPLSLQSPWPLQAEEKAILPETDTRDSRAWRRGAASQP